MRVCRIIEPDLKQITVSLLTSFGLSQGLTNVDVLAKKLIEFLTQLPSIVIFYFVNFFCQNFLLILKIKNKRFQMSLLRIVKI